MALDLRALRQDAADLLPGLVGGFQPGADREALVTRHDELALRFLTVAVATLLLDGDVRAYQANLLRAAENGRRILALLAARGLALPPASRHTPLLAAVAAGDLARGQAIARLARTTCASEDDEYPDEFCWARALGQLVLGDAPAAQRLLAELQALGAEGYEGRQLVAEALLRGDGPGFAEAFAQAAAAHGAEIEERARSFATPVTSFAPHRFAWLEGLALLRLAARAGIEPPDEYRYCPQLARALLPDATPGEWVVSTGIPG